MARTLCAIEQEILIQLTAEEVEKEIQNECGNNLLIDDFLIPDPFDVK